MEPLVIAPEHGLAHIVQSGAFDLAVVHLGGAADGPFLVPSSDLLELLPEGIFQVKRY